MLAYLQSGIFTIKEIRRFPNEPVDYGGTLHWDVARLWFEVRKTLAALEEIPLASIGVDAWGVDYALLAERGELLQNPYHYRDRRTEGIMEEIFRSVSKEEIYRTTGIQFLQINTLVQLVAQQRDCPRILAAAQNLITIPDLFNYWLTGNSVCEYANATTTRLVDPLKRTWATGLMERLSLPSSLPAPIVEPGSIIGTLLPGIVRGPSFAGIPIIAPACHDTGSAVAAITARDGIAFLSSGTWSLLGVELPGPIISSDSLKLNFTNEGGVDGTTRLLKNVMGLWVLRGCRQSWAVHGQSYDYDELMNLGAQEVPFRHLIDPDDDSFFQPPDMLTAIDEFSTRTHQPAPREPKTYVRTVLDSLAPKYRLVLRDLERVTGKHIEQIRVIGGGSKNRLLNQMTADATGKRVLAGPAEATALGNVAMQVLATGGAASLGEVRSMVDRSFHTEVFEPLESAHWDRHAERFEQYCESIYA